MTRIKKAEKSNTVIDIGEIIQKVQKGELDLAFFTKTRTIIKYPVNALIWGGITALSGWFSVLSSEFYLIYGKEGAELLPLGDKEFNEKMAGFACFLCNVILNFYFSLLTTIEAREQYLIYQFRQKNNIPTSPKKIISKLLIGLALSMFASYPFFLLSLATHNLEDEIATGFVNILLNFIGSYFLEMLLINLFMVISEKCSGKNTEHETKNSNKNHQSNGNLIKITDYKNEFFENLNRLESLPNEEFENDTSVKEFLLTNIYTSLLTYNPKKQTNSCINFLKTCGRLTVHTVFQFFNAVSCYGLYFNTVDSTGKNLGIDNDVLKYLVGTAIFSISSAIMVKVTYETANSVLSTLSSLFDKRNKSTFADKLFLIPKIIIIGGNYYIAFLSASSTLAINDEYDFSELWAIIASCLGATIFNGYGGMGLVLSSFDFLKEVLFFSKRKSEIISTGRKTHKLLENLPENTYVYISLFSNQKHKTISNERKENITGNLRVGNTV